MRGNDSISLDEDQGRAIASLLEDLLDRSGGDAALLTRQDGASLCTAGDLSGLDLVGVSALTAAAVGTGLEMAKLLNEVEFTVSMTQGPRRRLHSAMVDRSTLVTVVYTDREVEASAIEATRSVGLEIARVLATADAEREDEPEGAGPDFEETDDPVTRQTLDTVFNQDEEE